MKISNFGFNQKKTTVKKEMGIGEKPSSDNSSNEEIGGFKNQIEKGGKLERNE